MTDRAVRESRALERALEALGVERLEQVVERGKLEGLERVLVVGSHEDRRGHLGGPNRLEYVETRHARHLHIEEHEIRTRRTDHFDGCHAVGRGAYHLYACMVLEEVEQASTAEWFVVDDQHS